MKALLPLLFLFAACAGPAPEVSGGPCSLDRRAVLPVAVVQNVPLVGVVINGRPATMVLDTGADLTMLTQTAARRLGLVPEEGVSISTVSAGGEGVAGFARIDGLLLGEAASPGRLVGVAPISLPRWDGRPLDGLLGTDVLGEYDVELDLPNATVTLYRARPCPGALPPWPEPFQVLERRDVLPGTLFVPAWLDGVGLTALLDTGTSLTVVTPRVAWAAGVTAEVLARAPVLRSVTSGPNGLLTRAVRFRELRLGEEALHGPVLLVAPLPPSAGDALLGGEYLASRRVWLSFATGQVFVARPRPRPEVHIHPAR